MCLQLQETTPRSGSAMLVKIANFPEWTDWNGGGCHRKEGIKWGNLQFYLKTLSPLGDSKLCFRLTENERFNGEYADKPFQPLPPESVCL